MMPLSPFRAVRLVAVALVSGVRAATLKLRSISLFVGVIFLCLSSAVQASMVSFEFRGIINSVVDQLGELDGSIVVGTSFSGTYTFESTTPGTSVTADRVDYVWRNATGSDGFFTLAIGNYAFESSPTDPSLQTNVTDGVTDAYQTNAQFVQTSGPLFPLFYPNPDPTGKTMNPQGNFTLLLENGDPNIFASTALPLSPPDLGLFGSNSITIQDGRANKVFRGLLTNLSIIPIPAALPLFLSALGVMGFVGWRKQRA